MSADIFSEDDLRIYTDLQLGYLEAKRSRLRLSAAVDEPAQAFCRKAGCDESVLRREWVNDALEYTDFYIQAVEKPDAHYLTWLESRVMDPYMIPPRAFDTASNLLGSDTPKFAEQIWEQELAWAHRLRRSPDQKTVLLCELFLKAARLDTRKEFLGLAAVYAAESEKVEYIAAVEHGYTPDQIRSGYGSERFGPLFLKYAEREYAEKLAGFMGNNVHIFVEKIRAKEEEEMQRMARERVVSTMVGGRMTRMVSVIRAALGMGLDSDWLLRAHDVFIEQVREGKVPLPVSGGIPISEFLSWLHLQKFSAPPAPPAHVDNGRSEELSKLVNHPQRWLATVPPELMELGAGDVLNYQEWVFPLTQNIRPAPADLILDYGFFIVGKVLARRTTTKAAERSV